MTPNEMLSMIAQLRRERNEARQQYDDLATEHVLAINKLAEERDEALMDRANGDMATMTINHYERLIKERDEARQQLRIAVGLLSTQPQFADKHPEDVLAFVKECGRCPVCTPEQKCWECANDVSQEGVE
jgi:vacuolar-type H+-ATPase subunit E/Vma4